MPDHQAFPAHGVCAEPGASGWRNGRVHANGGEGAVNLVGVFVVTAQTHWPME